MLIKELSIVLKISKTHNFGTVSESCTRSSRAITTPSVLWSLSLRCLQTSTRRVRSSTSLEWFSPRLIKSIKPSAISRILSLPTLLLSRERQTLLSKLVFFTKNKRISIKQWENMKLQSPATRATSKSINTWPGAASKKVTSIKLSKISSKLSNLSQDKEILCTFKGDATWLRTILRKLWSSSKRQLSNIQERLLTGLLLLSFITWTEITVILSRTSSRPLPLTPWSQRFGTILVSSMKNASNQKRLWSLTLKFKISTLATLIQSKELMISNHLSTTIKTDRTKEFSI